MESIGERLRQARESRKLTVRDVVKQTNISPQYIEALEEEEFERFPSETYLVGFLRSYSDFLKLDPDEMIMAYRGHKISESATPLEELTRPTGFNAKTFIDTVIAANMKLVMLGGGVIVLVLFVIVIITGRKNEPDIRATDTIETITRDYSKRISSPEYGTVSQLQLVGDKGIVLVSRNEAVQFVVDGREAVFILHDIVALGEERAVLHLMPDKTPAELAINTPVVVTFPGIRRDVVVTLKGTTDNRAKILVALGQGRELTANELQAEARDKAQASAMSGKALKITLQARFKQKSFVEIYLDGTLKTRGFVAEGASERWEATETIQIKMGNAGGVDITINEKPYVFGYIINCSKIKFICIKIRSKRK